ncbi:MAG: glycoside hydrolase [Ardenticatenaceae bacterium]|nr:hypothetical protein [Anaerolineales bacterium]MCB8922660.1 glycoside hydrolase [Ardenticatenaceae bacterium]MCB9003632.1 glycoside hydrolase [Ardenticatenaceae bacterium]
MNHATEPRPANPLVSQNSFRTQSYISRSAPSFLDARAHLPEPVLPERPEWVEMYWRAWELAWGHLKRPQSGSGFVANYLSAAGKPHVFLWDTAFMLQFGVYGRRAFDFVCSLDNFYARQHEDGFICREIDPETGQDHYYPFDPDSTGPNVLAWAEWRHYRATGDDARIAQIFWPLLAYHQWFRANRTWQSGLYWATGKSSGMSNQPRVPDSRNHHRHWSWVDASMQAALNCRTLEQMATLLQESEWAQALAEEHTRLAKVINTSLWSEEAAFYQDVDGNGRFSRTKSVGAYWGLSDKKLIPKDRLDLFVQHLRDSWAFNLPHRVPSLSADSDGYNAQTGHYWRGAVWAQTNYMLLKGLRTVGRYKLAHEIALNHLQNVADVYVRTDTLWDNYAPETAAPGDPARPNFVGMTGLTPISMLLEDIIGVAVDWPQRRVIWDRRLQTNQPYGVRNYPLGEEGTLELLGDAAQISITTDVPFTLEIREVDGQTLQTAVPVGTTEIDLT